MNIANLLALIAASCTFTTATHAADLLLKNVNGYTLDKSGELQRFEALLIDQGKVLATGTAKALGARAGDARVQDGEGRTLLPGLIDAHGHVMGLGYLKAEVDLSAAKSLDDALAMVKSFAQRNPDASWIRGRGWNQEVWKLGRFPTAAELDKAVSDRPVWLSRVDGHAGWANSAAMQKAGVDSATKAPDGGRIERDDKDHPTGIFIDAAMDLVANSVPPRSAAEADTALDAALTEMASLGMTGVHDAGIDFDTYNRYRRYADAHRLTTRIYAMIGGTGEDFDRISVNGPLIGYGGDFLSVRSVKLFADGALGSRGAALLADYSDQPGNRGLLFHPQAEMIAMIGKAISKGYQTNVHAIGDRGNHVVLDSFAGAYAKHGGKHLRNRIEHAQVLTDADISRFPGLALIASMQPTHATSDMNMAEDRLGSARIKGAYAWQRFLKQGTVVAAGSDFPVEYPNPFFGLHAAVTRQDHHNQPDGGWFPKQALSLQQALRAFTLDAAWAAHQEKELGTLESGKYADFILIDRDIFKGPASELRQTRVLETWVGGKQVYTAKP